MQGDMYGVDIGQGPQVELGVLPGDRFEASEEKGRIAARQMAWRSVYNALTLCQFQNPGPDAIARALNAITGWTSSPEDLLAAGKRILTIKRLINLQRGLTREDERLPDILSRPIDGPTEGFVPDQEALIAGAYAELGWDLTTGHPSEEALASLAAILPQPPT